MLRQVLALASELGHQSSLPESLSLGRDPDEVAWRLCAVAPVSSFDKQRLLEAPSHTQRLALLHELVRAVAEDIGRLLAGG